MRLIAGLLILAIAWSGVAAPVAASDAGVIVLGLRSLEGDDDFANSLTDALRTATKTVPEWRLINRAVSMAQMTLAHNCDEVDAACLSDIAKGLQADRVVFGTVRRTAARAKYDFEVTVSVYNDNTHAISATETDTIARADSRQKRAIAQQAQMLIGKLSTADANAGRLSIEVNVSTAEVHLDDQMVGQTHEGKLVLDTITPGEHKLEISAVGYESHTEHIVVSAAELTTVSVTLEPSVAPTVAATPTPTAPPSATTAQPSESSSLAWLGYTLIGVGAASALAWGGSMYVIEYKYNRDATFQMYRNSYGVQSVDACDEALNGNKSPDLSDSQFDDFRSQCRTGRTFQVLQWVFLGTAAAAAIAGTYVLLTDDSGERSQARARQQRRLSLSPTVGKRSVALEATLRF